MSGRRGCTLLVLDGGARLLDGQREVPLAGPGDLAEALPAGARVQVVLLGGGLAVHCAEVPFLPPRERGDAARRLAREAGFPPGQEVAHALEADPRAEGGHALWLATCPRADLDPWLAALRAAGAAPACAVPWQRALAAAAPPDRHGSLVLALDGEVARLLFFRGRGLRFSRTFRLPSGLDPGAPGEAGLLERARLVAEELTLLLHFLRQRHRGAPPEALAVAGLPAGALPALEALDLPVEDLGPALGPLLARGAGLEAGRALDLLPSDLRLARRAALFRAVVRAGVAGTLLLGGGAKAFLVHHERGLAAEVVQAEAAAERRGALARDGEEAARERFALLRVRRAEERQVREAQELEQLGLRLLRASEGVELEKAEITQDPARDLVHRFRVEGTARPGRRFSLGHLAAYVGHLKGHPGLELDPIREVKVEDGATRGQAKFHLGGTAP